MKKDPNYCVSKHFHFYAAHRNTAILGKCSSVHGHVYHVDVSVSAAKNEETGVTVLFEELDKRIAYLKSDLDHVLLLAEGDDLIPVFAAYNKTAPVRSKVLVLPMKQTSAENLAKYVAARMTSLEWEVTKVVLRETESSTVTYKP